MRILDSRQMREADRRTIEEIGITSLVLMENAGRQVVAAIEATHGELLEGQVAVLCGRGNNGGDGFVVARTLLQRGVDVSVFVIGRVADVRGDARINLEILGRLGLSVVEIADGQAWELHFSEVTDSSLIIDAIFGTGLNAPLSGLFETVVADVNASEIPVIAVDLPSGLSADSHEPIGPADRSGLDRDARGAQAVAGAAAGRDPRRRRRHRRYRHSRRRHRRPRGGARRAADARDHARAHRAAIGGQPQGGLRPRAARSPDRAARPAPRICPRSGRCAQAPVWSRLPRRTAARPSSPVWGRST